MCELFIIKVSSYKRLLTNNHFSKREKMKQLATRLKQSFLKLEGQGDSKLTLNVDQHVNAKPGKKSIDRTGVTSTQNVDVKDLSHVSFTNGETVGPCVRLIFGDKLYATCGEKAEEIINWVEESSISPTKSKIKSFPQVPFQLVLGSVKVLNGEITLV